jgi:hypothetical protein
MDEALRLASDFMEPGVAVRSVESKTGIQLIQEFVDSQGQRITKRVGFDVNPNSPHVRQLGPHINLQTQINGKIQTSGPLSDPHIPIDPKTVRKGDY